MSEIEKAIRPDSTSRPGWYTAALDERWCVGTKLHGGYLLALCARAATVAVTDAGPADTTRSQPEHTAPHAVTGTFLRAPDPGPADLFVDVLRSGRSVSQVRVRIDQDERPCVEAAVTLGGPVVARDGDASGPPPVELTPFEDCPRSPADGGEGRGPLPLMDVVDTRLDPATSGFVRRRPAGVGRLTGWGELADRTPWDAVGLLVALDLLPPASFDLGVAGWTPTMSFTAHVPGEPAAGPLRLEQVLDHLTGDRMHESCRAWDGEGRLVGVATQVAAVRR